MTPRHIALPPGKTRMAGTSPAMTEAFISKG
jgi:hypothetical protein